MTKRVWQSNVVPLKKKMADDYRERLVELRGDLDSFIERLGDSAFELLLRAEWRQWGEDAAVGTQFQMNEKLMLESGNPHVAQIHQLAIAVTETRNALAQVIEENQNG